MDQLDLLEQVDMVDLAGLEDPVAIFQMEDLLVVEEEQMTMTTRPLHLDLGHQVQ